MGFPWYLGWPLLSSVLYVAGVLLVKRSTLFGVGVWRTAFVSNMVAGMIFVPLLAFGDGGVRWPLWWQPAIVALLFLSGQALTFVALNRGDVSIATPVLGSKIILVALFSTLLLAEVPSGVLWVSAGLSTAAIGLLNLGGRTPGRNVRSTIILSLFAAASFALFDVLVQKWAGNWGASRFLPVMFIFVVLYSLLFIPLFRAPLRAIERPAWPWLLGGCLFIALQAVALISTVAVYGDATAVNVVYSSRGLWSVLAVWWIGHWFQNTEQHLGRRVLKWRLAGAALLLVAIVLVMFQPST